MDLLRQVHGYRRADEVRGVVVVKRCVQEAEAISGGV
jgi:hypothetical protein